MLSKKPFKRHNGKKECANMWLIPGLEYQLLTTDELAISPRAREHNRATDKSSNQRWGS